MSTVNPSAGGIAKTVLVHTVSAVDNRMFRLSPAAAFLHFRYLKARECVMFKEVGQGYAGLLPSPHAIAAAAWRLGVPPDGRFWDVVLIEAVRTEPVALRFLLTPDIGSIERLGGYQNRR